MVKFKKLFFFFFNEPRLVENKPFRDKKTTMILYIKFFFSFTEQICPHKKLPYFHLHVAYISIIASETQMPN